MSAPQIHRTLSEANVNIIFLQDTEPLVKFPLLIMQILDKIYKSAIINVEKAQKNTVEER